MGIETLDHSFVYYKDTKKKRKCNSRNLIPKILEAFKAGSGYTLNIGSFVGESNNEGKKLFRKMLKKHLKKALRHEPVFTRDNCGGGLAYTVWEN
jgi:hypothetical protein